MSPAAAPPSPQEIHRKLSVHSAAKSARPSNVVVAPVSGTESDSDSILSPDFVNTSATTGHSGLYPQAGPLTSIAERRVGSGEDSEDDDEEDGGWKTADARVTAHNSVDEGVIKAGYLWKKGERRKTWKKRWFVLRPAHLAYYKTSAEYQLLRLLELADVHSCTQVNLKKHDNTFGLVSPVRTFYLQAKTQVEVREWVSAIEEAREALMATSTQNSMTNPIPIPTSGTSNFHLHPPVTPSPPRTYGSHLHNITSSDSDDGSPTAQRTYSSSSQTRPPIPSSPTKPHTSTTNSKAIAAGYLMKCGSKRHNWRKRYFVLTGEKLVYSGSHMDTKPHRQFPFSEILDAFEYDLPTNRHNPVLISPLVASSSPIAATVPDEGDDAHDAHTFKIITTKRTLLLCAASEEDEVKWLGAVRALIARRSGAGVVPGETASRGTAPNAEGPTGSSAIGSSGTGYKGKTRRLSASGPTLSGSVEEGRLEKQQA